VAKDPRPRDHADVARDIAPEHGGDVSHAIPLQGGGQQLPARPQPLRCFQASA
jgi:hypothetical protein